MRKLVYLIATTVDGYIASHADRNPEFFHFEGPQVADLIKEFPEMIPAHARPQLGMCPGTPNQRFDTALMGRATYEIGLALGVPNPYPHLRQIIMSSSLDTSPDPVVEVWSIDVTDRVRELKSGTGKDIWLCGGSTLATALIEEIDEFILKVSPVILGGGVSLFSDIVGPRQLTMTDHRIYDNGFSLLRFVPNADEATRRSTQ